MGLLIIFRLPAVLALLLLGSFSITACAQSPNTPQQSPPPALPNGSRLITVNDHALHVRSLGVDSNKTKAVGPAIVLLSGPTDHWHSDSGWFALLQPLLAKQYRVHAIDRPGHGFSAIVAGGSYQSFADDLATLLPQLEQDPVIVIAFASSNLTLHHYAAKFGRKGLHSVLLIDPDGLNPELVSFYAEQAKPFQQPDKLAEYVNAGKYDARAQSFYKEEREHLVTILPAALTAEMDWPFYDAIATQRLDRARILARFAETGRYDADVTGAAAQPWPAELPVWSYDTDFELTAVEAATEPAEKQKLERWRRLSSEFMQALPGHCRIGSASREHLATVAEADRLLRLIDRMAQGLGCPPETR